MNAKMCKKLRKAVKNWREATYIQDKRHPIPNLELPPPPDGLHYRGKVLVVNPIRLNPTCGRLMYLFLKARVAEKMTVVPR